MKKKVFTIIVFYFAVFLYSSTAVFSEQVATVAEKLKVDTDKYPNKSLVQAAWENYNVKDYESALVYVERCIASYDTAAKKMQASLKSAIPQDKINQYWALNDVAVAKFIKGKILWFKKDVEGAKKIMSDVANNYKYAMAYDLSGWYWSVANAAKDSLKAYELGIDFGNSSSSFLTSEAWNAYNKKDYKAAIGFAEQCIKMYQDAALWQQKSLSKYPEQEQILKYWALNDVGTCYYIAGKCYRKLGDKDKSKEYFKYIKEHLLYSSCWDPKGFFWKVVEGI